MTAMQSRRARWTPVAHEPTTIAPDETRAALNAVDEHRDYRLVCCALILATDGHDERTEFTVRDLEHLLWHESRAGRVGLLDVPQNLPASLGHLTHQHGRFALAEAGLSGKVTRYRVRDLRQVYKVAQVVSVAGARTRLREAWADLPLHREIRGVVRVDAPG